MCGEKTRQCSFPLKRGKNFLAGKDSSQSGVLLHMMLKFESLLLLPCCVMQQISWISRCTVDTLLYWSRLFHLDWVTRRGMKLPVDRLLSSPQRLSLILVPPHRCPGGCLAIPDPENPMWHAHRVSMLSVRALHTTCTDESAYS